MKEFGKTGEILDDFWINMEKLIRCWKILEGVGNSDGILRKIRKC